jgi:Patched family
VKDALQTIGASVLIGGFSTFLGVLPLFFSSSELLRTLFFAFIGMVLLGCSHGLILLPVLLLCFGPLDTPGTRFATTNHADSYYEESTLPVSDCSDATKAPVSPNEQHCNESPRMPIMLGGNEIAGETNSSVSSLGYKLSELTNEDNRTSTENRAGGITVEQSSGGHTDRETALAVASQCEEMETPLDDCILIPAELEVASISLDIHVPCGFTLNDNVPRDTFHDTPCDWLHVARTEKTTEQNESRPVSSSNDRELQTQEESSRLEEVPIENSFVSSPSRAASCEEDADDDTTSEREGPHVYDVIAQMTIAVKTQVEVLSDTPMQTQDAQNPSSVPPPEDLCRLTAEITTNIHVVETEHQQSTSERTTSTAGIANEADFVRRTDNACEGSSREVEDDCYNHDDCTATINSTPQLEITIAENVCINAECVTSPDPSVSTGFGTQAFSCSNLELIAGEEAGEETNAGLNQKH